MDLQVKFNIDKTGIVEGMAISKGDIFTVLKKIN